MRSCFTVSLELPPDPCGPWVVSTLTTTRAVGVPDPRGARHLPGGRRRAGAPRGRGPGSWASGSTSCQGARTKARSWARGWGRVRTGSSETTSAYATMSTSIVRGPQRSSRTRWKASSTAWARSRSEDGREGRLEDDHRVEVRRLAARLHAPRLRLVHRRDRFDADARGVLQGVDGALEGLQAVAEVRAQGEHGALGVVQGRVGGVHAAPPRRRAPAVRSGRSGPR